MEEQDSLLLSHFLDRAIDSGGVGGFWTGPQTVEGRGGSGPGHRQWRGGDSDLNCRLLGRSPALGIWWIHSLRCEAVGAPSIEAQISFPSDNGLCSPKHHDPEMVYKVIIKSCMLHAMVSQKRLPVFLLALQPETSPTLSDQGPAHVTCVWVL